VLVDRRAVAGNWSGKQGCTSGLLPLGTPPEKDVEWSAYLREVAKKAEAEIVGGKSSASTSPMSSGS
jgi:hypothetical protein